MQRRDVGASSFLYRPTDQNRRPATGRADRQTDIRECCRERQNPPAAKRNDNRDVRAPIRPCRPYRSISCRWISSARTEIWISQMETPSEPISSSNATPKTQADAPYSPT